MALKHGYKWRESKPGCVTICIGSYKELTTYLRGIQKKRLPLIFLSITMMVIISCNPVATTSISTTTPTISPTAALTPTPIVILGPVGRFTPQAADVSEYYQETESRFSEYIVNQLVTQVDIPRENVGIASFRNKLTRSFYQPQDGQYIEFIYWVVLAHDTQHAMQAYQLSNLPAFVKQAFFVIMPDAVYEQMGAVESIQYEQIDCDDLTIYKSLVEITDMSMLYIYAGCRIENVVIYFWGYTPNNYDGKKSPIPDELIANQVMTFLSVVIDKLT
jgi:hypothetical protein